MAHHNLTERAAASGRAGETAGAALTLRNLAFQAGDIAETARQDEIDAARWRSRFRLTVIFGGALGLILGHLIADWLIPAIVAAQLGGGL